MSCSALMKELVSMIMQNIIDVPFFFSCSTSTPYVEQKGSGTRTKIKKKIQNYQQQMSNEGTV